MTRWTPPKVEEFGDLMHRLFGVESKEMLTVTFQVTEDCNMRCSYCYQHNKSAKRMSFETAKTIIDNLLSDKYGTENKKALVIDFIGGEPFKEIGLIQQITDYFMQQAIMRNHRFLARFRISISTNGLLYFDPQVQAYLKQYKDFISLSVSIDGNKRLHDTCRIDEFGHGTYDRAIRAEKDYAYRYGDQLQTKFTISPQNVYYVNEAILNLISEGYNNIALNCIYEEGWTQHHAQVLFYQLKSLADCLIDNDAFQKYNISLFDREKYCPMDASDNKNWCGGVGGYMMAFNPDGVMYPCIRYMESSIGNKQEPFRLGTIDGVDEKGQERLDMLSTITRRSQSTDECFNCPVAKGCAWCSAYNYECFGTPNKRATFTCWMHKATALANYYYFNKGYKMLGDEERMPISLPKEDALQLISREEWEELCSL